MNWFLLLFYPLKHSCFGKVLYKCILGGGGRRVYEVTQVFPPISDPSGNVFPLIKFLFPSQNSQHWWCHLFTNRFCFNCPVGWFDDRGSQKGCRVCVKTPSIAPPPRRNITGRARRSSVRREILSLLLAFIFARCNRGVLALKVSFSECICHVAFWLYCNTNPIILSKVSLLFFS